MQPLCLLRLILLREYSLQSKVKTRPPAHPPSGRPVPKRKSLTQKAMPQHTKRDYSFKYYIPIK